MSFNTAHRNYCDVLMQAEVMKLLGKRKPSTRKAAKASYDSSLAADKAQRPKSPNGWYTATAKAVNKAIEQESKSAVRTAYKKLKSEGKLSSLDNVPSLALVALAASGAVVATKGSNDVSRRTMLGMGVAAVGVALIAPTQASADNTAYIDQVRKGAQSYSSKNAKNEVVMGAGIRG